MNFTTFKHKDMTADDYRYILQSFPAESNTLHCEVKYSAKTDKKCLNRFISWLLKNKTLSRTITTCQIRSSWLIGLADLKHNYGLFCAINVSNFWLRLFFFTFMNDLAVKYFRIRKESICYSLFYNLRIAIPTEPYPVHDEIFLYSSLSRIKYWNLSLQI